MTLGRLAARLALAAMVAAGCSSGASPAPGGVSPSAVAPGSTASASPVEVTVYAAASLKAVLATVRTTYEAANPGTTITISTDSSSALEAKIEQGAPADVFLSADTANPARLVEQGLAAGAPVSFAGNRLTVIVPTGNPAGIGTPADLARAGTRILACGDAVPIATYAATLVANLAAQPGYPADFVARYTANVVSREDNVAAVVAKVALGEGDAGIVYVTDARTSTEVIEIPVPDAANVPVTDTGVVVKAAASMVAAQSFLRWLAGPSGQAILRTFGFLPPP